MAEDKAKLLCSVAIDEGFRQRGRSHPRRRTQVVFAFRLSPALVGQGIALALAVGLIGGPTLPW